MSFQNAHIENFENESFKRFRDKDLIATMARTRANVMSGLQQLLIGSSGSR